MATSTELLRAAEHMRERSEAFSAARDAVSAYGCEVAANTLTCEAKRLQAIEARQRSWPEGWPPFAVLRRAYESLGVHHNPSTMWCERRGGRMGQADARDVRVKWSKALLDHSSP